MSILHKLSIEYTREKDISYFNLMNSKFNNGLNLDRYLKNPNLMWVVAKFYGDIIGISMVEVKPDKTVHSNYSWVDEDYRGQGVNQKLKKSVLSYCKLSRIEAITANVRDCNDKSISSLMKAGYKVQSVGKTKYKNGDNTVAVSLKLRK